MIFIFLFFITSIPGRISTTKTGSISVDGDSYDVTSYDHTIGAELSKLMDQAEDAVSLFFVSHAVFRRNKIRNGIEKKISAKNFSIG